MIYSFERQTVIIVAFLVTLSFFFLHEHVFWLGSIKNLRQNFCSRLLWLFYDCFLQIHHNIQVHDHKTFSWSKTSAQCVDFTILLPTDHCVWYYIPFSPQCILVNNQIKFLVLSNHCSRYYYDIYIILKAKIIIITIIMILLRSNLFQIKVNQ